MDGLDLELKRMLQSVQAFDLKVFGAMSGSEDVLCMESLKFLIANFFALACSLNFFTTTLLTNQRAALEWSGIW